MATYAYMAHLVQAAAGCDKTIACGEKLIRVSPAFLDAMQDELKRLVLAEYPYRSEFRLARAHLYTVVDSVELPIEQWYSEHQTTIVELKRDEMEERLRALYETLKARYE